MKTQSKREHEEQDVSSNGSDGQADATALAPGAEVEVEPRAAEESDVAGETTAGDGSAGTALGTDWLQEAQVPAPTTSTPATKGPVAGSIRIGTTILRTGLPRLSLDDRVGRILLSIVLAVLLWVYVVNLENPAQTTVFTGVPLQVRGLAPNLKLINQVPNVNTTVLAPQNVMATLTQADVRPYIDLSGTNEGVHEVPVRVEVVEAPQGSVDVSLFPRTVQVQLQAQVTQAFSISAQITGVPAFGGSSEPAQIDPAQVVVTGPDDAVARIASVVAPVDVQGQVSNQRGFITPVALDGNGQVIKDLTFDPATVEVVVPITTLDTNRVVSVNPQVVGQPAPGFRPSLITAEPNIVTICCTPSELQKVEFLDTIPIAITGTTSTIVTTTEVILPPNVSLYPGQSKFITVTVSVEALVTELELSIAPEVEGQQGQNSVVLSPTQLSVTLAGTFSQLQGLKPTDVRAILSLGNRGPGTYDIEPQIVVPNGVTVQGTAPQRVTVTIIAPTQVPPTPTPTAQPSATPTLTAEPTVTPPVTINPVPTPAAVASPTSTTLPSPSPSPSPPPQAPATPTHTVAPSPAPAGGQSLGELTPTITSTP
ncbi:MAG TPA: CdaR family protein [Chloroflexia bacterium]|jgi:YbbR domain-containing protein